ncbi:hypothetical protein ACN2XU_12235 [Primorskyibacter sp. 2E107]|uniref:hypothetical protein n=1 Tax=Primorskyibacter sp. 2E107 TaxID=3403458 RepID=UPI003AF550BF
MSLQLLTRTASFDAATFESEAENRANAGLSLLQRWTERSASWQLYEVADEARAKAWLDKSAALGHAPAAAHFLRTA